MSRRTAFDIPAYELDGKKYNARLHRHESSRYSARLVELLSVQHFKRNVMLDPLLDDAWCLFTVTRRPGCRAAMHAIQKYNSSSKVGRFPVTCLHDLSSQKTTSHRPSSPLHRQDIVSQGAPLGFKREADGCASGRQWRG